MAPAGRTEPQILPQVLPKVLPKVLYVANARIPSHRAHSIQIVRACEALTRAGADVELWIPRRSGVSHEPPTSAEIRRHYGVPAPYPIRRLPCVDIIDRVVLARQRPAFLVQTATFVASVRWRLRRASHTRGWIYIRDPHTLAFLGWRRPDLRARMVFEAHSVPRRPWSRERLRRALRGVPKVVALNAELAEDYEALGVDPTAIRVVAADAPSLAPLPDRAEARRSLGLDPEQRVVLYAGSFGPSKGVEVQIAAARGLRPPWRWILVGGDEDSCRRLRSLAGDAPHIDIRPAVRPAQIDDFLAAADILVATGSADDPASARWTSPMKLFDYDRARRPVVLSDLPALRSAAKQLAATGSSEDFSHQHLFWCRPDDPDDLALAVKEAWSRRADIVYSQPRSDGRVIRAETLLEHLES